MDGTESLSTIEKMTEHEADSRQTVAPLSPSHVQSKLSKRPLFAYDLEIGWVLGCFSKK